MHIHTSARLTLMAAAVVAAVGAQAQTAAPLKADDSKAEGRSAIQKVEIKGSADAYNARRDDTASKIVVSRARRRSVYPVDPALRMTLEMRF